MYDIRDRTVPGGCSLFRPDFAFWSHTGGHVVVVEVDESQHKYVKVPSCELPRMVQIHNDFGGPGVIFLRYNPDSYLDADGVRRKADRNRGRRLIETVKKLQCADAFQGMVICHLYFDGWDGDNLGFKFVDYVAPEQQLYDWKPTFSQ